MFPQPIRSFLTHLLESQSSDPETSGLASLPTELVLKIFEGLNRVASTCFGLTCTTFYVIYKSLHGKVPLVSFVQPSRNRIYESTDSLFIRLKSWMAPRYVFDHSRKKFVRVDVDGERGVGVYEG